MRIVENKQIYLDQPWVGDIKEDPLSLTIHLNLKTNKLSGHGFFKRQEANFKGFLVDTRGDELKFEGEMESFESLEMLGVNLKDIKFDEVINRITGSILIEDGEASVKEERFETAFTI